MNWFRAVIAVQVLIWVLIGLGIYSYGPPLARGLMERIDHVIGYSAKKDGS